jgi:crotonobetainyl-CoA:carnitine CoA-transferase CaiB-like acyl-CoA transferase
LQHESGAGSPGAAALEVVEISTGVAGAYAGWLLARMGAQVARVAHDKDNARGPLDASELGRRQFNAGKAAAAASCDALLLQLQGADIVICDDRARLEQLTGLAVPDLARAFPTPVLGIASVFGLTGPLADAPAVELDAQAAASIAWVLGEKGREPLSIPPGILPCQAGAHLAASCLMAHLAGGGDGTARIVDIALADVLASYVGVNCRFLVHHGMEWQRAGRRASNSGGAYPFVILPCKDGDVCLSGRTRDEWNRFVRAMGDPAWAQEPRYQNLRAMGQSYPDEVDALVMPLLAPLTKAELADLALRHQLTIAPVREMAEVLETPHYAGRGFFEAATAQGVAVRTPALPFKVSATRVENAADQSGVLLARAGGQRDQQRRVDPVKPLAGLRVLDFGWVWSAPQVGGVLAQFGAQVIKVEHGQRLDNTRLSGWVMRDGVKIEGPTTDMSPMFHQINRGKLGITLNVKEPRAVALLKRLAAASDIVIENMSPGAMERTGLGFEALTEVNDRLIMLAMSGAGQFGPLADMRTYAPVMSSFVGLEALVGYRGERPLGALNVALGDPNAAAHGLVAVFAALLARDATGQGCYIDLSQTEALLATLTPYLLQAQMQGRQPAPMGNRSADAAPRGIYPARGPDQWISLAVGDDRQWRALTGLAAGRSFASDERLATMAGRLAHADELDAAIASWSEGQDRDALVVALRGFGVAASPVQSIDELWRDPQLAARAMTDPVALPAQGEIPLFRPPWRFSHLDPAPSPPGPLLGEHNALVFCDLLGLPQDEFDTLVADGVIA